MKSYDDLKAKMNFSEVNLPSNRKFGFFFTAVFFAISFYFYIETNELLIYFFCILAAILFVVTLVKADLLLPLNKLWMRLGFLLGLIVSPIIFGIIFFLVFTPIAVLMRLLGRDELRLRFRKQSSHWIKREAAIQTEFFKYQF